MHHGESQPLYLTLLFGGALPETGKTDVSRSKNVFHTKVNIFRVGTGSCSFLCHGLVLSTKTTKLRTGSRRHAAALIGKLRSASVRKDDRVVLVHLPFESKRLEVGEGLPGTTNHVSSVIVTQEPNRISKVICMTLNINRQKLLVELEKNVRVLVEIHTEILVVLGILAFFSRRIANGVFEIITKGKREVSDREFESIKNYMVVVELENVLSNSKSSCFDVTEIALNCGTNVKVESSIVVERVAVDHDQIAFAMETRVSLAPTLKVRIA